MTQEQALALFDAIIFVLTGATQRLCNGYPPGLELEISAAREMVRKAFANVQGPHYTSSP